MKIVAYKKLGSDKFISEMIFNHPETIEFDGIVFSLVIKEKEYINEHITTMPCMGTEIKYTYENEEAILTTPNFDNRIRLKSNHEWCSWEYFFRYQWEVEGSDIQRLNWFISDKFFGRDDKISVLLENGNVLQNDRGKYRSGLCLIHSKPGNWVWKDMSAEFTKSSGINRDAQGVRGSYSISKKGTKCFYPSIDGKDVLYLLNYGRDFAKVSHQLPDIKGAKYQILARSNGGGAGNQWVVMALDLEQLPSEGDI